MHSPKQLTFLALIITQLLGGIYCGTYDRTDTWLSSKANFPENAVWGGFDSSGYDIYVGRVAYSEAILPARVVPELETATFNNDLIASQLTRYDLLVSNETMSYHWRRSYDGFLEKNAVSVGTNNSYVPTYICRARTDGGLIIGTLYLAQRKCIIRYHNVSVKNFDKYEVLVRETKLPKWVPLNALDNN